MSKDPRDHGPNVVTVRLGLGLGLGLCLVRARVGWGRGGIATEMALEECLGLGVPRRSPARIM